jgi:hypothetical protein
MTQHRRLLNHNSKTVTDPLASLLADIQGQTGKLHAAVESATAPPAATDIATKVGSIQGTADTVSAATMAITNALAAISADVQADITTEIAALRQGAATLTAAAADISTDADAIEADAATIAAQKGAQASQPAPQPVPPIPAPIPAQPQQPSQTPPVASSGISWPSFTGSDRLVGASKSGMVAVYVDAALGAEATQNAVDLLADADRIVTMNNTIFGKTQKTPVNVILFAIDAQTDGSGGADHMGCDWSSGSDIEVCVSYGDSARCSGLFMAELCECAMNNNLCGLSTGETLSRWCAAVASSNALSDFATAPTWQQDGLQNFVDATDPTDNNPDSIGCGMAFLSYLLHRGATMPQIAQAMVKLGDAGTLAALYAALKMGDRGLAWPTFGAAVSALGNITDDDPFAQVAMAMRAHEHV